MAKMSVRPDLESLSERDRAVHLGVAEALLDRLKPRRRLALVLPEIEGRSWEAVAEVVRVSLATARVLFIGRRLS